MGVERIGTIKCFLCSEVAPVKEQNKTGFTMFHCQWCGFQCYARGKDSDARLRAKMTAVAEPTLDDVPPKPAPKVEPKVVPAPKPALKEEKKRGVFGI